MVSGAGALGAAGNICLRQSVGFVPASFGSSSSDPSCQNPPCTCDSAM